MGSRGSSSGAKTGSGIMAPIETPRSNNTQRIIQVLDGNRKPVFEGVFSEYQDFVRAGKFGDDYSTRVIKKSGTDLGPKLANKNDVISFVKNQTNVDLTKLVEPKAGKSRTFLGVHLEDLGRNQRNAVTSILNKYGVRIESNGGYGDAIYYKK